MAISCYLQAEEGPNIGYRKRMHQYGKDYGLFQLEEQHLACQVRSILKQGKLSKVEIEGLKRQTEQLHCLRRLQLELVIKLRALAKTFTAKRLKLLLKNSKQSSVQYFLK